MKALIIGLELEWRRGTGEKKQFGSPRGRASRTLPRLKLGRRLDRRRLRSVRSVCAQQINFLGGPASISPHSG